VDIYLNEEHKMLQQTIKSFLEKELVPLVDEAEAKHKFPVDFFRKMGQLGYLCVNFPEKYDGAGLGVIGESIVVEELARVCAGVAAGVMLQSGIGLTSILDHGTEEQKQKYVVPAIKGEKIAAFGLTEPGAGSDAASIKTRAERKGDHYVINGRKTFITHANICDFILVAAWTDRSQKPGKGISIIVVDQGTPGFEVTRILDKVGFLSSETAELVFEDCKVPAENLIGEEGKGFGYLMGSLTHGRITHAFSSVGIAQAAFEEALRYAQEREQFGRPIGKFQSISFKLARMATQLQAARLLGYQAGWLYDQGLNCTKEASMAKLFASEMAAYVTGEAMHIFGGYGYMMEYPVQRFWRDAKLRQVTEGTSEVQQMVIAKELGL